jgi:hypothetical protein
MEELRAQAMGVLANLSEEQLIMVIAYAQCVKDGEPPLRIAELSKLLEEERA